MSNLFKVAPLFCSRAWGSNPSSLAHALKHNVMLTTKAVVNLGHVYSYQDLVAGQVSLNSEGLVIITI